MYFTKLNMIFVLNYIGSCDKNKIKRHISSHKEAIPFTTNCKYKDKMFGFIINLSNYIPVIYR